MSTETEQEEAIVECLKHGCINLAKELDGLIDPDPATDRIMHCCIEVGFSFGIAWNKSNPQQNLEDRIHETVALIAKKLEKS